MPEFTYVARALDGSLTEGSLEANDRAAAIRQIEALKRVPIKITAAVGSSKPTPPPPKKAKANSPGISISSGGAPAAAPTTPSAAPSVTADATLSLPLAQLFLFTEQLAHLLVAGMTLDESLNILVRRLQQPKLQALSRALHQGLVDGRSLSQVMRDFPRIFNSLYVNMVSAGEASGALPQILRRLVTHLAGVKALRDSVTAALWYPAALVIAGLGLIIIFMTVMVPQLTGFFTSTGQQLPLPTRIVLSANHILTHYWWLAAVAGGGAIAGWKMITRSPEGRLLWDRTVWDLPIFSRIPKYRFYAQFARTLGTLISNGVTLLRSLELVEEISGNEWIRTQMIEVRKSVMDGSSLSNALRQHQIFPDLFLDMMSVGEQTGRFADTMQQIADVYERELNKQVSFISTVVPIFIIVALAVVVGLVVFGILAAVFNLTTGLHHQGR